MASEQALDLSIVIPTFEEEGNVGSVVTEVRAVCGQLGIEHEVLVCDGGSQDATVARAKEAGARVILQKRAGYGAALQEAFAEVRGRYVITLDSDLSHPPNVIRGLYRNRHRGEILIASRFVKGGQANMPLFRKVLSRILNGVFGIYLAMPVKDLSSGFRLYHADLLRRIATEHTDFSFLQEILVRAYSAGYRVQEIPFHYFPRVHGYSKARIIKFGFSYLKLLRRSRRLRNTRASGDYEERVYSTWFLPVRWWHRRRYRLVTRQSQRSGRVLQVGCGSRIFEALPGAVGMGRNRNKLRYRRTLGNPLVCADLRQMPFASSSFDQVLCTLVLERAGHDPRIFSELARVLRPGGSLVVDTPDGSRWQWHAAHRLYRILVPSGRREVLRSPYTLESLETALREHGFTVETVDHVFGAEMVVKAKLE